MIPTDRFKRRVREPSHFLTDPTYESWFEPGDLCFVLRDQPVPKGKLRILTRGGVMLVDEDDIEQQEKR